MKLYLFDFDGTLYNGDSMFDFLKYVHKNIFKYWLLNAFFIPFFLLKLLRLINTTQAKTLFLKIHLFLYKSDYIVNCSMQFSIKVKEKLFKKAKDYLNTISGEKCIVSASVDIWMKDISKELGVNLICTESIFKDGKFSKILTNCNEDEKLNRIKSFYNLKDFESINAYGNSKGDMAMYSLGKKHHKIFIGNE